MPAKEEAAWKDNLILICEKCGHKIDPKENPTADLTHWLKKKIVSSGHWGPTRVVTTSCMDICPEKEIAIAWISDRKDRPLEIEVVDPKKLDRDDLLARIVKRSP